MGRKYYNVSSGLLKTLMSIHTKDIFLNLTSQFFLISSNGNVVI